MTANIAGDELSPGGDIDSDGDVIPEADFSSTDDETSTNARVRRHSEKRRICRRVRVQRAVSRIEESEQSRSIIHPLGSDAECCPSLMMPGEDEELQQHASKGTLKAKPSEFDAPVASKEEKARCLRLGVEHMRASTAKERGVAGLATGIDVHATMWSGWRRLMTDHMSMAWMRSMQRIGESVAAVFEREKTAGLSTGDDPVPACSDDDIYATDPIDSATRQEVPSTGQESWFQTAEDGQGHHCRFRSG